MFKYKINYEQKELEVGVGYMNQSIDFIGLIW